MKKLSILIVLVLSVLVANAQLDRSKAPKAGPAKKLELGEFTKFELKNGLKVIVVENHKLPVVSYSLSLDIDPIFEGDKVGYTSFAGDLMRTGTTNKTKDQIDEEIDFIGASLSTSSKGIYASSLKKHSPKLLDLMTDVLYNPSFPQEELDKILKQSLTGIKSEKDDPKSISRNIRQALMFGKESAYGEMATEEAYEKITIEDCKNYYETYYRPNVAYLVIVGDITPKQAKKTAKKYFSQWESKEVPTHQFTKPAGFDGPIYAIGHKDAANQSYITVSYPLDLKPGTPDALKASVMNKILGGGGFSARLLKNLREDKAWTYGAYSRINTDEHMGSFMAYSNVRGTITDSAFVEVYKEMQTIISEDVNEDDLQLVKNSLAGSFGRALEDPSTIARFAVNIDKYGLPADYYETYPERLEAITIADVKASAEKYIQPENALYLAVGDINVIEPLMQKIAHGKEVTEYDFYAEKVVRTGVPAGLTAEKVIETYVDAMGGAEKLKSVEDLSMKATLKIQGMELALNTYQQAPNKIKVETLMAGNVLSKQVYNGEVGIMVAQGQEQKLEGEMLETMKYQAILFPELQYQELGYTLELVGKDKIDGKNAYKMTITDPLGKASTVYFDVASGLKIKQVATSPMGNSTTIYAKYKETEGIKFPSVMSQTMGPQMVDIEVTSIELNKGLEESVFNN
ncbi:M16 family metallopeptidase [Labilibacter marinus]|uniref:M16 family metallopeptidase n=1 Tax=Labilibacter marinus TaxID=1477105 RepID=UPI0008338E5E|nr:pitrilysin family protein [Labilibacter marinus]